MNEAGTPREDSLQFLKAVEAAGECAQGSTEINETILWDVLDCTRGIIWTTQANRSAHNHMLLRPLLELSAQTLYMVLVHWSQQKVC